MNRTQCIALALGFSLVAAGCDDDFLTTLPPDQVSGAVFWQQQKDAELAVNALYNQNHGDMLAIRMEGASDNAWAQKSFDAWHPIGQGVVDPANGAINSIWNNAFSGIRRANEILANIDDIPTITPASLRDRLKGEAKFFRAYHYNNLVNLYGDVPLILTPISIEEGKVATRAPVADVVAQILKDLDEAAPVLPVSYGAADYGRATRGAALALKARAALYAAGNDRGGNPFSRDGAYRTARLNEAAAAAKAVMDLNVYSLHPNYAEITRYAADGGAEMIFTDRRERGVRGQSAFNWLGPRTLQGGSDITPLRELVDSYQMSDGLPMSQSPLFNAATPYDNRDPRMYSTLLFPGQSHCGTQFRSLPGSGTVDEVRSDFTATSTGFQFIKYVDCIDRNDRGNSGIDFILMRYADVLLMYAEARIELNQIDGTVVDAINAVRTRGGMPAVNTMNQAELRDVVRYERRAEFAMEGRRLWDIRRWGIAHEVMPGQKFGIDFVDGGQVRQWVADLRLFRPDRDYLWPIPLRELDLATGLTQNPGYQ